MRFRYSWATALPLIIAGLLALSNIWHPVAVIGVGLGLSIVSGLGRRNYCFIHFDRLDLANHVQTPRLWVECTGPLRGVSFYASPLATNFDPSNSGYQFFGVQAYGNLGHLARGRRLLRGPQGATSYCFEFSTEDDGWKQKLHGDGRVEVQFDGTTRWFSPKNVD